MELGLCHPCGAPGLISWVPISAWPSPSCAKRWERGSREKFSLDLSLSLPSKYTNSVFKSVMQSWCPSRPSDSEPASSTYQGELGPSGQSARDPETVCVVSCLVSFTTSCCLVATGAGSHTARVWAKGRVRRHHGLQGRACSCLPYTWAFSQNARRAK